MTMMPDNPDNLAGDLVEILRQGPPSEALKSEELSMRFSDLLDLLAEDRELGVLADIP